MRHRFLTAFLMLPALFMAQAPTNTFQQELHAWIKDHPSPKAEASADEKEKYDDLLAETTANWVAKWPEDASAWQWRLTSLAKLTTTPDSQIESVGEMLLKVNKEHPFQGVRFVSYKTEVAQIWMRRNIRLEDCLELAREGLADVEHAEQANPSAANRFKSMFGRGEMQSLLVEAEAARKLNKLDIAAQATAEMERRRDDDPAKYSTRGPANPWTEMNRPLARFQGIDLTGRTWTREDFKGKSTLVVIWATWCGPCHAELPQVQKLFEAITDRKNVQLVTVSTDKSADDVRASLQRTSTRSQSCR